MAGEMDGLGRVFNVVPVAADTPWVSLRDADAVTFVCVGANNETFTLSEAKDASGTNSQTLVTIDKYHKNTSSTGATPWVREPLTGNQVAASVITTTTAHPVAVFTVRASELSDGYTHLRVASSSTGTVVAITHDLRVQRVPQNLPAVAS